MLRGRLVKTGVHVHPEKVGDPKTALAVLKAQCPRLKRAGPDPHPIGKIRTQECWNFTPRPDLPFRVWVKVSTLDGSLEVQDLSGHRVFLLWTLGQGPQT